MPTPHCRPANRMARAARVSACLPPVFLLSPRGRRSVGKCDGKHNSDSSRGLLSWRRRRASGTSGCFLTEGAPGPLAVFFSLVAAGGQLFNCGDDGTDAAA
jgi:hypothetical protein